ncbi:hypoxia-inducible factor 1-alpha-like isoform X2 [Penaeus japonicus]|uniref:Hypoxia inducible factor 1 alpha n=1 Tax=Penaeus japonicus TaxID=27405 RepID=A0A3T0XU19_PENJP|nr:hypoxia-inducible factor 1-alpha-like isoform X2 [Penaeus japonicus]BBC61944.1 hypoxia inducible factor 1 alpha [Penaeus japonicus]
MCLRTNFEAVGRGARPFKRASANSAKAQKNSEKRKEKSRDAARCRRGKESEIFTELASALPLPAQTVSQLDKASVMRLTIAYLKTRALCQGGFPKITEGGSCASNGGGGGKMDVEMDTLFLKALDGFLLVLSTDGDVVYTSENIVIFLGLSQVDVMGQSLYEYTHPCDHEEVRELVSAKGPQEPRHAFLRLKCTLTAKGRSVNLKSASYKVVQVSGEVVQHEEDQTWLVALGTPVPHPSNIEFPLDKQTFVSKHSLDMKFTYVDDNVGEFCGYGPKELVGRSLYEMHHALDSELVKDAYKTLRSKGQVETGQYRFLARGGGYVWLVTQATLIHGPKDHKPQYVVCLNYVVSGVESPGEILSELQLMCSKSSSTNSSKEPDSTCSKVESSSPPVSISSPTVAPSVPTPTLPLPKSPTQSKTPRVTPAGPPPTPVATTSKIFAPRTEEMNKGFLTFSEDDPQCTVLKEEPEDLTHLAPSGGDTCVPLPAFMPNLDDMFSFDYGQIPISTTDVLFTTASSVSEEQESNSGYEKKLISDEKRISSRLSGGNVIINNSIGNSPASSCGSPHPAGLRTPEPPKPLLSQAALPSILEKKINFGNLDCSSRPRTTTESFFSQLDENSNPGTEFTKLDLKMEDQNMDSDEFDMRAPYIPHSDEMLVLSSDDLLWGAEVEPAVSPKNQLGYHKDTKNFTLNSKEDSSLAQLLRDADPPITSCHTGKDSKDDNGGGSRQNQYEQNKFFDGGENFVDPNKVLPGHCIGKDGLDGSPGCNDQGEDEPPAVMVQETVEPPPPLITIDTNQMSLAVKRGLSPNSSPILTQKKLCSLSFRQRQMLSSQASGDGHLALLQPQQQQAGGVRLLTTPYAPTMQQLLISKEPITVRGRHSGGLTAHQSSNNDSRHSVLRNLLDVDEIGSIARREPQPGGSGVSSATSRPSQDRMTDMAGTGGSETNSGNHPSTPKLRLVTSSQGTLMHAGHLAIKVASKSSGDGLFKRVRRQDPLLLMDPDLSIPDLLDLTQLDYEVNAPANNCSLLQGSDLLMALDQSP